MGAARAVAVAKVLPKPIVVDLDAVRREATGQ
jgi:hypothetical protein